LGGAAHPADEFPPSLQKFFQRNALARKVLLYYGVRCVVGGDVPAADRLVALAQSKLGDGIQQEVFFLFGGALCCCLLMS
jgi:hypothetical protein